MRISLAAGLLVLSITEPAVAQIVRCELNIYQVSYGLGGACVTEPAPDSVEQTRTSRSRFWPKGAVSVFVAAGPISSTPVPGLFYQSDWHDPFLVDLERMSPDDQRLLIRTSGATLIVDEWKQLGPGRVSLVFDLNFAPASANDVAILQSALARFNEDKTWNRASDQNCEDETPGEINLFCVLQATVTSQMGRYHHAQPAVDVVRALIAERFRDRYSGHMLVDFNNHAKTTLSEVRGLLESAIVRARMEASSRK